MPNGLLEALGAGQFTPFAYEQPVSIAGVVPLIIITSNDERVLPDAFIRRCLVLHLALPGDPAKLIAYLKERGRAHFRDKTNDDVLQHAAELLVEDRTFAVKEQLRPFPGQAEYLDLVRAVIELAPKNVKRQQKLPKEVAHFTLKKHPTMLANVTEREGS